LCGSGVIDAVAELLQAGVIASSGRFVTLEPGAKQPWADRLRTESGSPTFILASGTGSNSTIGITQKDVRQVQLAKGAIHSWILVLLRSLGVDLSEIDRVYLAGAFGCHVRMESMARIGLLAEELLDRVTLVGNSSKSGAIVCLLSQVKRAEAMRIVQGVEYVELSCYPDFDRLFARCLAFPNSSAETLTTKHDLSIGLENSFSALDTSLFPEVKLVSLSTTLATNSLVEGKGARVGLIISVPNESTFRVPSHVPADEVAVIRGAHNRQGDETAPLDLVAAGEAIRHMKNKVDAFAVSGYF
jgi:hypothetical protein